MGAMGIGQVGSHIDLMGLDLGKEFLNRRHIALRHRQLLNLTTLIERQIEEVDMLAIDTIILTSQTSLTTTDESLQTQNLFVIKIALFLVLDKCLHYLIAVLDHLVAAIGKNGVETIDEVHEAAHLLITHGNIARGLIGHMHIVMLLHQSADGTTHGDDVIIGMGREHDNPFRIRCGTFRTRRIIDTRFTTRPTCNGVLQFVEHLDIHQSCLSVELLNEVSKAIVHIVLGGELQQRLTHLLTQINHLPTQLVVGHLDS